ncbi:MAG: transporter, partial [Steroidobacteraceae bacterium]
MSWQRFLPGSCVACAVLAFSTVISAQEAAARQEIADAWWTGPLLAPSASTLPAGHVLIEPYLFDVTTHGRFDEQGNRHSTSREHTVGSLTYMLYGVTDRVTAGVIPQFAFRHGTGTSSSGVGVGDLQVQAQYRLTQFQEGQRVPTMSLVVGETLPTGKYDRLGNRPSDGMGSGVYTTTVSLYSQYYFWMPNGRILRTRLDLSRAFSDTARLDDVSVYGTPEGFRGRTAPGDSFVADLAFEYSATRNWVLALDVVYSRSASTSVDGSNPGSATPLHVESGSSRTLYLAPAIEYNVTANVGFIAGVRVVPDGRNSSATVT